MNARVESTIRRHVGRRFARGFSLLEVIISMGIVLVVAGGMAAFYGMSTRANAVDRMNVQLLNSARAKTEQIQSVPYTQVGIQAAAGSPSGPAYFETDPWNTPTWGDIAAGDLPLSDTVTLPDGTVVTRTVTVTAVDDPSDGIGANDADGTVDPNTNTILDYKLVTVTVSAEGKQLPLLTQTLTTMLQGSLLVEVVGATGEDADPADIPTQSTKVGKTTTSKAKGAPDPDCAIAEPPPGGKGGKAGTNC
jgi:prepilin-type N-terminal cleavage/methylation domain-containing protein